VNIARCSSLKYTDVSDVRTASIIRVMSKPYPCGMSVQLGDQELATARNA
jgi:hypothetical protein